MLKRIEEINDNWLLLVLLILSVISLIPPWIHYDIISEDGAFHYIPVAKMYLEGDFFRALSLEMPVYPVLLAAISLFTGSDFELAGRLLSAVFYIMSAIGLFKLSQSVFNSNAVAFVSGIFMITNRDLMDLGVDCLKDTFVLCLIIWATYFMTYWSLVKRKHVFFILSIFLYLIGTSVRSTAVIFLISLFLIWVISIRNWRSRLALILLLITGLAGAYCFKGLIAQYGNLRSFNLDLLKINSNIFMQVLRYFECYFTASNPMAVIIAGYGMILLFRRNIYTKLVTAVFFVSLLFFGMRDYISDRYMMPMIIMLYPVSAYFIIKWFSSGKKIVQFIGILAIVYSIAQWVDLSFTRPEPRRLAIRYAGQWIYENYGSDLKISTNQARVIFYARNNFKIEDRPKFGNIDLSSPADIIAVDISKDDGADIKKNIEKRGGSLLNQVYPIYIYNLKK